MLNINDRLHVRLKPPYNQSKNAGPKKVLIQPFASGID